MGWHERDISGGAAWAGYLRWDGMGGTARVGRYRLDDIDLAMWAGRHGVELRTVFCFFLCFFVFLLVGLRMHQRMVQVIQFCRVTVDRESPLSVFLLSSTPGVEG